MSAVYFGSIDGPLVIQPTVVRESLELWGWVEWAGDGNDADWEAIHPSERRESVVPAVIPDTSEGLWRAELRFEHEPRLAVVERYTVHALPVVDRTRSGPSTYPEEHVAWLGDEADLILVRRTHGEAVTDEPWAQGLVPGAVVLFLSDPQPVEPPITEMVCPCREVRSKASNWQLNSMTCETCGESHRLPLRLVPGLNEGIELAR